MSTSERDFRDYREDNPNYQVYPPLGTIGTYRTTGIDPGSFTPPNGPYKAGDLNPPLRSFGPATRDSLEGKIQWIKLFSLPALRAYGRYMDKHRDQGPDNPKREFDNWRSGDGLPNEVCLDSLVRHTFDLWDLSEGRKVVDPKDGHLVTKEEAACACVFNALAILHNEVK